MSELRPLTLAPGAWGAEVAPPVGLPDNWYMLATAAEVPQGAVLSRELAGRDVVLYRSRATQKVTAYAAACAHMGCHLRHAVGDKDGVRCGLHKRLIAADGAFVGQDGRAVKGLTQRIYPVTEAYGMIFVYSGAGEPPPLPLPRLLPGESYVSRPAGQFKGDAAWFSLVANGFDMEHLATVHGRRLREDAEISYPRPDAFRLTYRSRVIGNRLGDRLIKWISGDQVQASMTSWRGSMMFVESQLGARRSFFVLSMCPEAKGGTLVRCAVGVLQTRPKLTDRLRLWVTARLFRSFLSDDFQVLSGLNWHPPVQAHGLPDRQSQELGRFFRGLKQSGDWA